MEEVEYSKVAEDLVRHVIQTAMKEVEEEDAANSVREKMDGEANDIALSKQTTQKSGTDVSFTAGRVYRTKNHRKRPTTGAGKIPRPCFSEESPRTSAPLFKSDTKPSEVCHPISSYTMIFVQPIVLHSAEELPDTDDVTIYNSTDDMTMDDVIESVLPGTALAIKSVDNMRGEIKPEAEVARVAWEMTSLKGHGSGKKFSWKRAIRNLFCGCVKRRNNDN